MKSVIRSLSGWALILMVLAPTAVPEPSDGVSPADAMDPVTESTERGLRWLASQQSRKGFWSCEVGGAADVGTTATALMTFLSHGDTDERGEYAETVRRGIEWLFQRTRRSQLVDEGTTTLTSELGPTVHHFLAALAFSELRGTVRTDRLREEELKVLSERLLNGIPGFQRIEGRFESTGRAPVFSTTIAYIALRSGRATGTNTAASADDLRRYFTRAWTGEAYSTGDGLGNCLYENANAIRVLSTLGGDSASQLDRAMDRSTSYVINRNMEAIGGEEFLAFWFLSSVLCQQDDDRWEEWNREVSTLLIEIQNADGSWTGHGCINGRVFCTAVALLTLQCPNRYLPVEGL